MKLWDEWEGCTIYERNCHISGRKIVGQEDSHLLCNEKWRPILSTPAYWEQEVPFVSTSHWAWGAEGWVHFSLLFPCPSSQWTGCLGAFQSPKTHCKHPPCSTQSICTMLDIEILLFYLVTETRLSNFPDRVQKHHVLNLLMIRNTFLSPIKITQ